MIGNLRRARCSARRRVRHAWRITAEFPRQINGSYVVAYVVDKSIRRVNVPRPTTTTTVGAETLKQDFLPVPFKSDTYRILIASPGDLIDERRVATEAVYEWNVQHATAEAAVLLPIKWETHAIPEAGVRPQGALNRQIVDTCDLLLGMFWTKFGTDTGVAESGTVEEIDRVVAAGKPAMLYFSKRPIAPDKIDPKQHEKVREFKAETYKGSLVDGFASGEELRGKLLHHLMAQVRQMRSRALASAVQDIYFRLTDDKTITYKRKLWVFLKNETDKVVTIENGRWASRTGDIGVTYVEPLVWRVESHPGGWRQDHWAPGAETPVISVRPGHVFRTWIGLDDRANDDVVRNHQAMQRLGELVLRSNIDGKVEEIRIRR